MLNSIRKVTDSLVVFLFIALVVIVFAQVVLRLLSISFPIADELSRYCFVWLIYLGGTITIRKGMNITFDVLLDSLPYRSWRVLFTIVSVISALFLLMVVVLGGQLAWSNRIQVSSIMKLNMGAVMMAIPVGALLMFFEQVSHYFTTLKKQAALQAKEEL